MRSGVGHAAAVLALAGLLTATPSQTAVAGDPVVAARRASMKEMAAAAKAIAEMFDGKRAYDPAAFKAAANALSARTGPALIAEFPVGTLGAPSGAKPEIDQARPEFEALASHIGRLAEALAAKAEEAPAAIGDDMRMGTGLPMDGGSLLGKRPNAAAADPARMPAEHLLHLILQDCASCHSKFRQRQQ
ncbi:MAG: cytochrome c [Mesorhizobium sp.]|uniref:cytochrome c n=1 Tax=Mesorhizobium sp. TaxID=1871066 RepID=UPI000FE53BAC|nr:cytochrome c [Mesorhizobium sp.]RWD65533.1 MAG: cytochrome c [Mesorhizobium sp.]RWE39981.1 MAG: cytochrome c [Mesorhizobium sp.]TIV71463.1 MAG: cytochrome c [Mesorhizobium sp.]